MRPGLFARAVSTPVRLALLLLPIAACGPLPAPDVAFDAKEASYIHQKGRGRIEGHAFLTSRGGKVLSAAGERVRLVPATAYARKRFAALYSGRRFAPALQFRGMAANADYTASTRETTAESNGRFVFDNVAPGSYFVSTQKIWVDQRSQATEGGAFYEEVTLTGRESEPIRLVMSGK